MMDDDTHVIENQNTDDMDNGKKANPLLLGGVVLAVLLLFVGVALSQRNKANTSDQQVLSENQEVVVEEDSQFNEEMMADESNAEMVDQTEDTTGEAMEENLSEEVRTIEIDGGNFYFNPDTITVNKGEKVRIVFKNVEGMHDFVVEELDIKTPVTQMNETSEVEFTANETGEFEFYCSVGSHRQMGMKGTLVVQ